MSRRSSVHGPPVRAAAVADGWAGQSHPVVSAVSSPVVVRGR